MTYHRAGVCPARRVNLTNNEKIQILSKHQLD